MSELTGMVRNRPQEARCGPCGLGSLETTLKEVRPRMGHEERFRKDVETASEFQTFLASD